MSRNGSERINHLRLIGVEVFSGAAAATMAVPLFCFAGFAGMGVGAGAASGMEGASGISANTMSIIINNASTRSAEMIRILFSWLLPKKYIELAKARNTTNKPALV